MDFEVNYDTDIYTFVDASYPGLAHLDGQGNIEVDDDGEPDWYGNVAVHDMNSKEDPINKIKANASANSNAYKGFTNGKVLFTLELSCDAGAEVKVPVVTVKRLADATIAADDHGQSLAFSWTYTFAGLSDSGSFAGGVIPNDAYVIPAGEVAPTDAPTEAPTEAPTDAPTEAPTAAPTQAPTAAPTESTTKEITVGVISYVVNELGDSGYYVHYWGGSSGAGDALLNRNLAEIAYKSVGSEYWSGQQQTFYMYKASIPKDATGFKIYHKSSGRWFGNDGNATTQSKAYIFNYSGDKALYE